MHALRCILEFATRWIARALLVLLIAAAAAWIGLRWVIVPQIDGLRAPLERLATNALGIPIRAQALSAEAGGLGFAFTARGLDARGRDGSAVHVARVRVVFSIPSLLRGELKQVVIDQPAVRTARPLAALEPEGDVRRGLAHVALGWVLAQPEILVRNGTFAWNEPGIGAGTLALGGIQATYRGSVQRRALRVEATFGAEDRPLSLIARLRRRLPLPGATSWAGEAYLAASNIDAHRWDALARAWLPLPPLAPTWQSGTAGARAWIGIRRGMPHTASADVALRDAALVFRGAQPPLALQTLTSRVDWTPSHPGWRLATHDLRFDTGNAHWAHGDVALDYVPPRGSAPPAYALAARALDLAVVRQMAASLPLPERAQAVLARAQPAGEIEQVSARWSGAPEAPVQWHTEGRARRLTLAAQPNAQSTAEHPRPGLPGIEGADITWNASADGGSATLTLDHGALSFPGVFAEPDLPFDTLSAHATWEQKDGALDVRVGQLTLANADAQGTFTGRWTAALEADGSLDLPGALTLDGSLSRANGARVYRYLPLEIPTEARDYVRQAIKKGDVTGTSVHVAGKLRDFPFSQPGATGEFRISGAVSNAVMAYVPRALQGKGDAPWPALENLRGTLTFDRGGMHVANAAADVHGHPGWSFAGIDTRIDDLENPRVVVGATGAGKLEAALGIVRASPIAAMIDHALSEAHAEGTAKLQLKLDLPVDHLERSQVDGRVGLQDNTIRLRKDTVALKQARGSVHFDERGFAIENVQVALLGGTATVGGGMQASGTGDGTPVEIHAKGHATAEGLRAAHAWQPLPALARHLSGQADYQVQLRFAGATPEIDVTSTLRGIGSDLPAPLAKPAAAEWPLRFRLHPASDAGVERTELQVSDLLALALERRAAAVGGTGAVRGLVRIGTGAKAPARMPAHGIHVSVSEPELDADAWIAALETPDEEHAAPSGVAATDTEIAAYIPSSWDMQAATLHLLGRTWHDVDARGARRGDTWDADVNAREIAGNIAYDPGANQSSGRISARLARLDLVAEDTTGDGTTPESADDDDTERATEHLPAFDVHVDDFALHGRPLGTLELKAANRAARANAAADWHITQLALTMPEARLTTSGTWAPTPHAGGTRRTALDLDLEVGDAGKFLARFGMADVLAHGKGSIKGHLDWHGAPIAPDVQSLSGTLHLDMGAGRFLKSEPGVGRLLGVLSLQALPRRLTLDFRDVFSSGFAFDSVTSDVSVKNGVASTENFRMQGVSALVLITGSADLQTQTQDLRVAVIPDLDTGTAALATALINPVIGLGAFLAQLALKAPLTKAATREYQLTGPWADPHVEAAKPKPAARTPRLQPEAGNIP